MFNNYRCLHVMYFHYSTVLFNRNITLESNQCEEIVTVKSLQKHAYIESMEFSVIKFTNNTYTNLITVKIDNNHNKLNPYCFFQYVTIRNTSLASTMHYAIVITDKSFDKCKLSFHLSTSHCKWLNKTVFYGLNSGSTNQKIIQINHQPLHRHTTICHYFNCATDALGVPRTNITNRTFYAMQH